MPASFYRDITLPSLAAYIESDPAGWKDVSFLYIPSAMESSSLAVAVESLVQSDSQLLSLKGQDGSSVLLGVKAPQLAGIEIPKTCYWADNIAVQWQDVCAQLAPEKRSPAPSEPIARQDHPVSILIVEDDPMTSKMIARYLERFGTVIATVNSRTAIANYMVRRPDIIFLDIHYTDDKGDGFDVLQNLLSTDKDSFIVMVSADRIPGTVLKSYVCGAKGFIAKPFRPEDFERYLTKLGSESRCLSG